MEKIFVAEYYYRCGRRRHHSDSCSDCKSCDDTLTGSAGVSLFYVFLLCLTLHSARRSYRPLWWVYSGQEGDTRFGLILDVSTMWGCSILLGMIAAFVFHAPVQVVYILLMSDEVIKVPITVMRYRSYKWIQNVTREKAELA